MLGLKAQVTLKDDLKDPILPLEDQSYLLSS